MSKAIMISIRPKWVAKILHGEKTIEIRKSIPKCDLPIEVYIYCCKPKYGEIGCHINFKRIEGKVVGKFTLNKADEIKFSDKEVQDKACLTEEELFDYLFVNTPYHEDMRKGYAWHIDNLKIFDTQKELSEFKVRSHKVNGIGLNGEPQKFEILKSLNKAPQSYCFVEKEN